MLKHRTWDDTRNDDPTVDGEIGQVTLGGPDFNAGADKVGLGDNSPLVAARPDQSETLVGVVDDGKNNVDLSGLGDGESGNQPEQTDQTETTQKAGADDFDAGADPDVAYGGPVDFSPAIAEPGPDALVG